jgi:hypothetical protein
MNEITDYGALQKVLILIIVYNMGKDLQLHTGWIFGAQQGICVPINITAPTIIVDVNIANTKHMTSVLMDSTAYVAMV